jgi:tetratricopeptide (TPR) repeat protein
MGPCMINVVCILGILSATVMAGQTAATPPPSAMDRAFDRLYNYDFAGAHAILDEEMLRRPEDPLIYAVRGAAYLFGEFDRLKILELQFFADDDQVTDRKKLKPDPKAREQLFKVTGEARKRALTRLAVNPNDHEAMFALCTAAGTETDYLGLIEKRYFKTYSLSKESQLYARKLLAMNPPFYDAYLTLGTVEYVVGNLNFFFRLFIRFDQIEGSKKKAIEDLKKVVDHGRYFPPFAKTLLAAIYLREKQPQQALAIMKELERDFPENPLVKKEIKRATDMINRAPRRISDE